MRKNVKGFAIIGLLALCVILVAGVFMLGKTPMGEDAMVNVDEPAKEAIPGAIADPPAVTVPEAKPVVVPPQSPDAAEQGGIDIPLTVIEEKPEPPELPDTAHRDDGLDEPPTDPALTNPDVKPDIAPAPVEPTRPKDPAPQGGDKNGNGEVFIPGFGWVKDEGGGGQGQQSQLDPDHSDFDKIIGH